MLTILTAVDYTVADSSNYVTVALEIRDTLHYYSIVYKDIQRLQKNHDPRSRDKWPGWNACSWWKFY